MKKIILSLNLLVMSLFSFSQLINENFSTGLPAGWSNTFANDTSWFFTNPGGQSISGTGFDSNFAIIDSDYRGSGNVQKSFLTTSTFSTSGQNVVTLKFSESYRVCCGSEGYVKVSTNGGTTYDTVATRTSSSVGYPNPSTVTTIDISSVAGNSATVSVQWEYNGSYDWWWAIDSVVVEASSVTCLTPSSLSADSIASDSAFLSWTENNSATSWEIEWGIAGFTQGSGTTTTTSSNPHILNGLSPSTTYSYYVRSICGAGDLSLWTGPYTFSTSIRGAQGLACTTGNPSIVFSEEFDDNSAGWTGSIGSGGGQWEIPDASGSSGTGASAAHSGSNYMNFEATSSPTTGGSIISPAIDLSLGTADAELSFWIHAYGADMGILEVGIGLSDTGTFNTVFTQNGQLQLFDSDPWQNVGVNLSAYIGDTIFIKFDLSNVAGYTSDMSIDLVEVSTCASCALPSNIFNSYLSADSVNLNWTENGTATQWEIEYDTTGFAFGTGNIVTINTDTFALIGGLDPNTTYDWRIRALCGPGNSSNWTNISSFTTLCNAFMAPYTESFDGTTTPQCWSKSNALGNPWVFGTPGFTWNTQGCTFIPADHTGNSGNYAALDFSGSGVSDVILEMPDIDVSTLTVPQLEFYFAMCGTGYTPINILYIDAWNGSTWTNVDSIQEETNGWKKYEFKLTNYTYSTSIVKLRFRASSAGNTVTMYLGDQGIDDVSIIEAPANNLSATAVVQPTGGCGGSATSIVEMNITNVGAAAQSGFQVGYSLNGIAITPETHSASIAAGASANYTFTTTANLSTGGNYEIEVYTILTGDVDNSNDTASSSIVSLSSVSSFPYLESFETGNGGWITSGNVNSSWALGTPSATLINSASDGTQAWVTNLTGSYNTSELAYLNSPCFDFTNITNPYIAMDIWYDIESYWDGAVLEASIDNGATWNVIGQKNDPTNWYNDTSAIMATNSIPDSWTGDGTDGGGPGPILAGSNGWVTANHAIDGLAGQSSVRLRVFFASDGSVVTEGFAVDNIRVFDSIPGLPIYPISIINTVDASGVSDSLGVKCWTTGTVAGIDMDGNNGISFTIIELSTSQHYGINVYNGNDVSAYVVTEGDSILLRGEIQQYNGLTEFVPDSIRLISAGKAIPAHQLVTTIDESMESTLIELQNLSITVISPTGTSGTNYTMTDGTNNFVMRVDNDTDIDDSTTFIVGDTICSVKGIGGQFDSSNPYTDGYQIFPMRFTDIDTTSCQVIGIDKIDSKSKLFDIYPNPSNGKFNVISSGFESNKVEINILDLNGKTVQTKIISNANNSLNKSIDLTEVAKGIYFISIQDGDTKIIEKLIIK